MANVEPLPGALEVPQALPGMEERNGPVWWRQESQEITPEERLLMGPHGKTIQHKRDEDMRFFNYNTNSEKVNERSGPVTEKDTQVRELLRVYDVDIAADQETNVNYSNLPENLHPQNRCRGWFKKHRIKTSHNIHATDIPGTRLQGGTSVRVINRMVDKVDRFEEDPSGMGRWCSVRIRGKNGMMLTLFSAYRPCTNKKGKKSVYSQQEDVLLENSDMVPPHKAFLRDLEVALKVVYDRGDQIVLGADMNLDIKSGKLDHLYRAFNLYETILDQHGRNGPRTYIGGTKTLDCIICSRTLEVTGCGYLSPDQSIGDHLVLWADFSLASALGEVTPQVPRASGRKLQLNDPKLVAKYLEKYAQKGRRRKSFQSDGGHVSCRGFSTNGGGPTTFSRISRGPMFQHRIFRSALPNHQNGTSRLVCDIT